jgi:hypothetical protein
LRVALEEPEAVHTVTKRDGDETLGLVIEAQEIFRRWEAAFHQQQTILATHPALPPDRERKLA